MKKILIIEDDATIAELYKKELEKAEYEVLVSEIAGEGLRMAEEDRPDLILLDIMMPAIDGFTIIRNLKEKKETAKIPIVILTNLGSSEVFVNEAKRLGIASYLMKYKTSLKDMVETVKKVLKKAK